MYNRIFLAGRIKEEIELQYTNNEIPFVRFEIVVHNPNSYYKNKPETFPCIIWRQNAVLFFEKVRKSMLVLLEGRLREQNNYLEVSANSFQILESKEEINPKTTSSNWSKTSSEFKNLEKTSPETASSNWSKTSSEFKNLEKTSPKTAFTNEQKIASESKDLGEKTTETAKDSDIGIDWGDLKTEKKDD